jgi:hypothetical protein
MQRGGWGGYLVAAPAAHDRRREMLGDATHGHPHLLGQTNKRSSSTDRRTGGTQLTNLLTR